MFKHIKRDTRAALGVNRVEYLMRISQDGPPLECFDLTNAMKLWADHPVRRPAKSKRHHSYKKRQSKSNNNCESSSTDDDDDDDDDDDTMSLKCEEHADHKFSKKVCFFSTVYFLNINIYFLKSLKLVICLASLIRHTDKI